MQKRYLTDLTSFRCCAWQVASKCSEDLSAIERMAAEHGAGAILVASCQRVEVYGWHACACEADWQSEGFAALLRLAEVAAGLQSLVLGEEQILGQVRSALAAASPDLRALGDVALAAARALRAETGFDTHSGHLLDRALWLSGLRAGGRIAVVGAGSVGKLVTRRAITLGFDSVVTIGRHQPTGQWCEGPGQSSDVLADLRSIGAVDVLVSCLGSFATPLTAADLPEIRALAVDLGTPRNLVPGLAVPVLTIAMMVAEAASRPQADSRDAALRRRLRELLEDRFERATSDSCSELGRLRLEVERVRKTEAERIARLHPELPTNTIEKITRGLVNQLFHRPTQRLRESDDREFEARVVGLFAAGAPGETEACQ